MFDLLSFKEKRASWHGQEKKFHVDFSYKELT
jgi:hypothetical protein